MRGLSCALLLAVACGEAGTSELTYPGAKLEDFILRFERGSIRVRNPKSGEPADVCRIVVKESGGAEVLGAEGRFKASATEKRVQLRQHANEEGLTLDVEVVLPVGSSLDVVLREGAIRVDGAFGHVRATTTNGDATAELAKCSSAQVKCSRGNVALDIRDPRVVGDCAAETMAGDAALTVAPGFRGPIQVYSGSAKLDLGAQPVVEMLLDPAKKSARGFAGTPLTEAEGKALFEKNEQPPALWVKTQRGTARFRVE